MILSVVIIRCVLSGNEINDKQDSSTTLEELTKNNIEVFAKINLKRTPAKHNFKLLRNLSR